jgi:hypothetical protein
VHDLATNHFGVVEIPTSRINRLPPLEAAKPPAPAASSDKPAPAKP